MKKKLIFGLPSLIVLNSFTMFPEYFISISMVRYFIFILNNFCKTYILKLV